MVLKVRTLRYLSNLDEVNQENDNVDVHVELDDGRVFSILVATPNNLFWCMENEGVDYYFGTPAVYVKFLTREHIERAIKALVDENNGYWLEIYGSLQE